MARRTSLIVEKDEAMPVRNAEDVVRARREVRTHAIGAGFNLVDQTKIVTAASEIARNTVDYGGGGTLCPGAGRPGARPGGGPALGHPAPRPTPSEPPLTSA